MIIQPKGKLPNSEILTLAQFIEYIKKRSPDELTHIFVGESLFLKVISYSIHSAKITKTQGGRKVKKNKFYSINFNGVIVMESRTLEPNEALALKLL